MSDAWIADDVCETHEWRSPAGDTIRFVTRTGAASRMMPPIVIDTVRVPQSHGGRFRGARHDERVVILPVVVPGPQTAGREELRRWARVLDPAHGEGTLTVVVGPYAGRQLVCAYEAGLAELEEDNGQPLERGALAFRAADPYWLDGSEQELIASLGEVDYLWFPFAGTWAAQPLILGASQIFAVVVADNTGDVDAWPIITVTGPGDDLAVINETTGKVIELSGTIGAGQTALIDTRPGHKTVTIDGTNAFGRLSDISELWPLIPGPNRIAIEFTGVARDEDEDVVNPTATTSVTFAWRARWLAA